MWLAVLCSVAVIGVLWFWWERLAVARCPVGIVVPGVATGLVTVQELPSADVGRVLLEAVTPEQNGTSPASGQARPGQPKGDRRGGTGSLGDAALPAGLALGVGLADWMHVDQNVLDAVAQWTHTDLENGFDLWRTVQAQDYKLATPGFEVNLRGHVGEQEVHDQLSGWAGSDLSMPEASNYPGSDLTLGGHEFNVKVGADSSAITEHL